MGSIRCVDLAHFAPLESNRPTGDEVQGVVEQVTGPGAQLVEKLARDEFSIVKNQVNNFKWNSKVVLGVLDDVAKVHPFISGTASI